VKRSGETPGREWTIRLATSNDAEALSVLAERTFRETFSSSNTLSDINAYCSGAFGVDFQRRELDDPSTSTLVAERDGDLIAYAQLVSHPAPASVVARRPIELKRFYVDRAFHGSSVSPALMRATQEHAEASGADVLWLGVWEHNPRAIRFYEKNGFQEVGEHLFTVGTDRQRDLVMCRHVGDSQLPRD
jgi:ribosomal protein S18 acetylase RimI-like enzyme